LRGSRSAGFNGPYGSRTTQYVGAVDSIEANTRNGLFQCKRERAADESGAMDGDSAWEAAVQHHFTLTIAIFRL
jgi:hypothetical protein